jgi:hypothetical protein
LGGRMWLLAALAWASPADAIRSDVAAVRERVNAPILVGSSDDSVFPLLEGLDVVTVLTLGDDPATLERALFGRGMRCAVQILPADGGWRIVEIGRCTPSAVVQPVAPGAATFVLPKRPWEVPRRPWLVARWLRGTGLGVTSVGLVAASMGVLSLEFGCTGDEGALACGLVTLAGAAVTVPGLVLVIVGQGLEDHLLADVVRCRWPGQAGAVAFGLGVGTLALLFTAGAWSDPLLVPEASLALAFAGVGLEGAQMLLDGSLLYPSWTLSVAPGRVGFSARW